MTKFLEILKKLFVWIKEHPAFFLCIICFILLFFLIQQCNKKNEYKHQEDQTIAYYTDSLRIEKNKSGQLEYQKNVLFADKKQLEQANKDLYNELQKEKGKVKIIIKTIVQIVHDTIRLHDTIIKHPNNQYEIQWKYKEYYTKDSLNFQGLSGNSLFQIDTIGGKFIPKSLGTTITENKIGFNIVTGIQQDKKTKNYEIFIRSDYPGFNVTHLDGAVLDPNMFNPKPKRFGIGPLIGVGIGSQFKPEIFIGLGLNYSIIRF